MSLPYIKKSRISISHKNRKAHNWLMYASNDYWLEKFKALIVGHVYDLGCGEAPYKSWLLECADRYTGVDWSGSQHDLAADILVDLNGCLPIDTKTADTVISLSVIEHLCEPQVFLNEAYRILKPGGSMLLQVPFMWWVHEPPHDFFRFTRYGLKYMFEKAGFSSVAIYPQTGFWVMATLKFNYQSTRVIRGPRVIRKVVTLLCRAIWTFNQRIAPWLDSRWPSEGETAGYFVIATKKIDVRQSS